MTQADAIARLAQLLGIGSTYGNAFGQTVDVSTETLQAILTGFGLPVGTEADARQSVEVMEALRHGLVPALMPVESGRAVRIPVRRASGIANWRVTDEEGVVREGRAWLADGALQLPAMPTGYHQLRVEAGGEVGQSTLIAAPAQCWEPDDIAQGARLWGATAQVYGLRSRTNFGIGNYTDVARTAQGAGALGASFLGLSPVHALFSSDRGKISPYSPSSRLFLETLFLDPTAVPGFGGSEAERLFSAPDTQERLKALRDAPLVDHQAIWDVKRPLLEALWKAFSSRSPDPAFTAFRREGGEALQAHATFEALSEYFRGQRKYWLGEWPIPYRDVRSQEVQLFRSEFPERIAFHAWLQWLADVQLAKASDAARQSGMAIGLYRDLAVGADSAGSEIWSNPDRFAGTLSVGAPPDPLGPQGQKWGLPPFNPLALERQSLAAFRDLVRANMRHAGAIRIDHAFQLRRLFLIPGDAPAAQGAYVDYPFEAMLAVLRLESHRHRCVVIAEDLGTAPEGFSDSIMASGVYSYRVLWFEREGGGHGGGAGFKRPADYPSKALAVFTTHDLPTFGGWWRGLDIELRQSFGIYDQEAADRERAIRSADKRYFTDALAAEGLLPAGDPPETAPLEPMMRFLARTTSALVGVQLEDAVGELYQANMPGPDLGHPNWKRRLATDIDAITAPGGDLAKLAAAMSTEGRGERPSAGALASPPPRATYRLQFHKDFTFDDAVRIVPYLKRLGISHLYASPIHKARPGSTHGYDIVDHAEINPELGGEEGFRRLSDALLEHGLGLILDIVPNHMGVGGADNDWWLSVIEWGDLSPHSRAFDIDWERLGANRRLVLPVLGDRYGDALEKGDLKLAYDPDRGFSVWHWEHRLPISPLTYPIVLDRALAALDDIQTPGAAIMMAASDRLRAMSEETIPERRAGFYEEAERLKVRLAEAVRTSPGLQRAVERAVTLVNGVAGQPESFGTIHRILELQSYRLAHWRVAASDINYRRFFDINTLAGVRVEDPEVFEHTHRMVFRLIAEGRIQGLRIDHIDGLAEPDGYARALQNAVGPGFYVVVEKILEPGEKMRPWPVAGTTGYDVLNLIDGVFVETRNGDAFEELYRKASGLEGSYGELLRSAKTDILEMSFASELEVLVSDLKRLADADRRTRDYTAFSMRRALIEIIARFPVYRSYLGDGAPTREDLVLVRDTIRRAKRSSALPDRSIHDFIAAALLGDIETEGPGRPAPDLVRRFRRRFQQLTGPVMAKSLEDTLFYRYARLISLNEVGGDPAHFGGSVEDFHKANALRLTDWPHAMIASATHDTKRGEDARARLNALSEMPEVWADAVRRFETICAPHLVEVDGAPAPDANDRYMFLQALLGAWPIELLGETEDAQVVASFRERIEGYVLKALREAKRHTSWVHGNEPYENAATGLVGGILRPKGKFLSEFRELAQRLAQLGVLSSLARTALKCTLPGVPDIYQGTEFWDLSLVDPDNRRPVDYDARTQGLGGQGAQQALLSDWRDGRIKQAVLTSILHDRADCPNLYAEGSYDPLQATGSRSENVVAFMRRRGEEALVVAVPRLISPLAGDGLALGGDAWGDTALPIPAGRWRDVITGAEFEVGPEGRRIGELLGAFPLSVLRART